MKVRCKVALVNCDFPESFSGVPMGLLYLAAVVRKKGHEPLFYDFVGCGLSTAQQVDAVLKDNPNIIAVTGMSPSAYECMEFGEEAAKKIGDNVWLIKGGYHERFFELKHSLYYYDFVCFANAGGDGLSALIDEWVKHSDKRRKRDFDALKRVGIFQKMAIEDPAVVIKQVDARKDLELENIVPCRDLISIEEAVQKYNYKGIFDEIPATQMITYRGCENKCVFCASTSEKKSNPDLIKKDIRDISKKGYGAVFIDDASFAKNWTRAKDIAVLLRKAGLVWGCQTGIVDVAEEGRLEFMKNNGCIYVYYGIESGSKRVQEALRKPLDRETIIKVIKKTRELGMTASCSFIFGVPVPMLYKKLGLNTSFEKQIVKDEDQDDWQASVDLIKDAEPNIAVPCIFSFYPQSPLWKHLDRDDMNHANKQFREGYWPEPSSRDKIWKCFDEGYGSVHNIDESAAKKIINFLNASDISKKISWLRPITPFLS